jgi:hypothetical protein
VFLYTLLIDDIIKGQRRQIHYYMIFYLHLCTLEEYVDIIREQITKLLRLSENLQKWEQCEYGDIIVMCNSDSLKAIRQCWEKYLTPDKSDAAQREEIGITTSKYMADKYPDFGNLTGSYGALSMASRFRAVHEAGTFWSSNNTICKVVGDAEYVNPLMVYSMGAGSKFAIPRDSNPHTGFHLSLSHPYVDHAPNTIYNRLGETDKCPEFNKTIVLEMIELLEWCDSFQDFVQRSRKGGNFLLIRVFVGDPCAFCFALDQRRANAVFSPLTSYVRPWVGKLVELDGSCYTGQTKVPAPLSFNVIDGSDAIDTFGLLNLLISVIPLLQPSPSSTISTDTRFWWGRDHEKEPELLARLLCGNVGNVCSLLGVAPISYLTGIGTGD